MVHYHRAKGTGPTIQGGDFAVIRGAAEIQIVQNYLDCFITPHDRRPDGRLFRKINHSGDRLFISNQRIGHNTASNFGKDVAKMLGLKDPHRYTGHCWRGTTITWAANAGLSLCQIKALSDHKSDTVVQGYISKSSYMKNANADAIALFSGGPPAKKARTDEAYSSPSSNGHHGYGGYGGHTVYNVVVNGTVHGAMFGGPTPNNSPI